MDPTKSRIHLLRKENSCELKHHKLLIAALIFCISLRDIEDSIEGEGHTFEEWYRNVLQAVQPKLKCSLPKSLTRAQVSDSIDSQRPLLINVC